MEQPKTDRVKEEIEFSDNLCDNAEASNDGKLFFREIIAKTEQQIIRIGLMLAFHLLIYITVKL